MAKFRCKVCDVVMDADVQACCSPGSLACNTKTPFHCGQPMLEIIDD